MKKVVSVMSVLVAIIVNGCGGGSSSPSEIDITISCITISPAVPSSVDIASYHELLSGDVVIKDTAEAIVQIYTPVDGNSRVCLESGTAHILRN